MRSLLKIALAASLLVVSNVCADGYFPEDLARMNGTQGDGLRNHDLRSGDSSLEDLKRELRRTSDSLARIQKSLESVSQAGYQKGRGVGLDSQGSAIEYDKGLLVATVDTEYAIGWSDYRPGASKLYRFDRGAKVAIEQRVGDWYRVHGSSSSRSWVEAKDVVFGTGVDGDFEGNIRVKGYDSEAGQSAVSLPFAQFAYFLSEH